MNTLEYAKLFMTELDEQVVAAATSGWMEANAGLVKYNGGDEIKIPKIAMDGLGDYDRDSGYVGGSVTLSYETMKMTKDRGRSFLLDAMDVDETNFVASASNIMGEFQRTKVIPEIDAYRYAKIAALAGANSRTSTYTPDAETIFDELKSDIETICDVAGDVQLVITMTYPVCDLLDKVPEIQRTVTVDDFSAGAFSTRVKMIDGFPIIRVPSSRMKSAYDFHDGVTSGQRAGGFAPASGAKGINWIICAQTTPIAVSKTDTMRIFDPLTTQSVNAWKIDYRKYHDLFIAENKFDTIWVSLGA